MEISPRHKIIAVAALIAASLLAPLVLNFMFPQLDDAPRVMALEDIGPVTLNESVAAEPLTVQLLKKENVGFIIPEELYQYQIQVPEAGRYTFYTYSKYERSMPVEFRLNGRPRTLMAMYQKTDDLEYHRLQQNVPLNAGENTFTLKGSELEGRSVAIYLYRQLPLTPLRHTLLAGITAAVLLPILLLGFWARKNDATQLAATLAAAAVFLLIAAAWSVRQHYTPMYHLGNSARGFENKLVEFDALLDSPEHDEISDSRFAICTFGDSTHYFNIEDPEAHHRPTLQRMLDEKSPDTFYIYGVAHGGRTAHDYYYLTNRIVSEKPDLLIITLNVHTFSQQFQQSLFFYQPNIYRFLRMAEYPNTRNLYLGDKRIELAQFLGQKFDARATGFKIVPYFEGLRLYLLKEWIYWEQQNHARITSNSAAEIAPPTGKAPAMWETNVTADNPMFEPFRLINDLTEKHGIPVLYYATPVNVPALEAQGIDVRQPENYAFIKEVIADRPHIRFLDLSDNRDPEIFSDDLEHLTPKGTHYIASHLTDFILEFKEQRDGDSPVE